MKKWLRRLLTAAALVGVTFGVLYECATHVGRGWLDGEAFYEGRPTSWWRNELEHWYAVDISMLLCSNLNEPQPPQPRPKLWIYSRDATVVDRLREGDWRVWQKEPPGSRIRSEPGPPIKLEEHGAEHMLRELADDPSPRVRHLARISLGLPTEDGE